MFSGSVVYDISVGKGKAYSTRNRFVDYILGNWQIGGIVSFYSGVPFDVNYSNGDLSNTGTTYERPNLVSNSVYASNRGPNLWLNPDAFATPAPFTFGNLGRNRFRSDSTKNLDFSLVRRFPIHEEMGFEFRADSFNLTNTPVFSSPNATLGNPNFGVITSTRNNPRELQFALKFVF